MIPSYETCTSHWYRYRCPLSQYRNARLLATDPSRTRYPRRSVSRNGLLFSSLVGFFMATLPSAILQTQHTRRRWMLTLGSGFTMFLGGYSWEGFGVSGELPIGIHQARIGEVIAQFGSGTTQREFVTARLRQIY